MKAKKIITIVFTSLAGLMVILSGVMKFVGGEDVSKTLTTMGVNDYRYFLGTMEVVFTALFIFPKTMKIGFLLLSCYFAGALATELSHNASLNALTPIILVWIAAFLRDRSIFLVEGKALTGQIA